MLKKEAMEQSDVQEVRVVSASVVAQLQAQGLQVSKDFILYNLTSIFFRLLIINVACHNSKCIYLLPHYEWFGLLCTLYYAP